MLILYIITVAFICGGGVFLLMNYASQRTKRFF
jgi:hypothetical protein